MQKAPGPLQSKLDPASHYEFLLGEELGFGLKLTEKNVPPGSMTWVIPDFNASSGGHINILRMMRLLKDRGFRDQHVVVMEPHRWSTNEEAQTALVEAFGDHGITVSLGVRSIEPSSYLVATGWQTAYWVAKYRDARHKIYFVQDFEPAFFAAGSEYSLAENTYRLGLTGITAGPWLADKLQKDYGMKTHPFSFACDTEFYNQRPKRDSGTRHIFFYARPVTTRRCFELGLMAIKKVCDEVPDAAAIMAGWDVSNYVIPFHHLNAGTVPLSELPDLYSQCDVALVLSATNLSLLPLEIASCGCPIVMNESANTDWLLSKKEAAYCDMDVDSIADTLIKVLKDDRLASRLAKNAKSRAHQQSWEAEADGVAAFLKSLDRKSRGKTSRKKVSSASNG